MNYKFMMALKQAGFDLQYADELQDEISYDVQNKICNLDRRIIKPLLYQSYQIVRKGEMNWNNAIEKCLEDQNFMCGLIKDYINGN